MDRSRRSRWCKRAGAIVATRVDAFLARVTHNQNELLVNADDVKPPEIGIGEGERYDADGEAADSERS